MESFPLVPSNSPKENPDTLHVLREVFQGFITQDDFPINIAKNITKQNISDPLVKEIGENAYNIYQDTQTEIAEITKTEENIMLTHGKLLITQDAIEKDKCLMESLKLKRVNMLSSLDEESLAKFPLLQKADIFPNKIKRCIDFRFYQNECEHMCQHAKDKCSNKIEKCKPKSSKFNKIKKTNKFLKFYDRDINNFTPKQLVKFTKFLMVKDPEQLFKLPKIEKRKYECQTIFIAVPETIVFHNYKVNIPYEKKFKLQNVSSSMQSFIPQEMSRNSHFKLHLTSDSLRIAPGMCATFKVSFKTDTYQDERRTITFRTCKGCDVTINLISFRNSPVLHAYVYRLLDDYYNRTGSSSSLQQNFNAARAAALNSTIDCGSCLLGTGLFLNVILHNEGESGSFFLMSEQDWYNYEVKDVSDCMILSTPSSFQIYPTYFHINKYELVELSVVFFPLSNGLQTEKIFMLCDNTSIEEIELTGDGITFDEDFIKLEIPEKLTDFSLFMDEESTYYIHFGNTLPFITHIKTFTIHNLSSLFIHFRWKFRKSNNTSPATILERIESDWAEITPKEGVLTPDNAQEFQIKVFVNKYNPGLYSAVFSFYILNIPQSSLRSNWNFTVIERDLVQHGPYKSQYVDIIRAEVEMVLNIVTLSLVIVPCPYTSPVILGFNDLHKHEIMLYTEDIFPLKCEWLSKNKSEGTCTQISPSIFTIYPNEVTTCELVIFVRSYEDIKENHTLSINNGSFTKEYEVFVKVGKPYAKFSRRLINFGPCIIGKVFTEEFCVTSSECTEIKWKILEYRYDQDKKGIIKLSDLNHLSQTEGVLNKNRNTQTITYSMSHQTDAVWLSFLVLLTSAANMKTVSSTCFITYEIISPRLIIHSSTSEGALICPSHLLYINNTKTYPICLHNDGYVPATYVWGVPYGKDVHAFKINFGPRWGKIEPQSCNHIKFSITPIANGIFKVMVPCFIGKIKKPLVLTIITNTSNIYVYIHLPEVNGSYKQVLWPVNFEDYEYGTMGECVCFPKEMYDICKDVKIEDVRLEEVGEERPIDGQMPPMDYNVRDHLINYNDDFMEESPVAPIPCTPSSSVTTSETELDVYPITREKLKEMFGENVVLRDHIVELKKVPHRVPYQTSVKIENLTPLLGCATVKTVNFFPVRREDECNVELLMNKLNLDKFNKWDEIMGKDFGLVVKAEPTIVKLKPTEMTNIDLFVYGDTWGTYIEEVVIEINDVRSFCFTLIIEIVGFPVEYPLAVNSITKYPTIRFGRVSYISEPVVKLLKVTNTSSVPIFIKWHTFEAPCKYEKLPFNVIFDLFDDNNSNTRGEIHLTNQYHGIEKSDKFELQPWELHLPPKSTSCVKISLDPSTININDFKEKQEFWLIGHLYVTDQYSFYPNMCRRKTDVEFQATKVNLHAVIEIPSLKLQNVEDELKFRIYATDSIENGVKTISRKFLFRNVKQSDFIITRAYVNKPFHIVQLESEFGKTNEKDNIFLTVPPGGCVEITVKCTVTRQMILKCVKQMIELPKEIAIVHPLIVFQRDYEQQLVPLMLEVLYPQMKVLPSELNFGDVVIGNTIKKSVTVLNCRAKELNIRVVSESKCGEFVVLPQQATIGKATSGGNAYVLLFIYFTPRDTLEYHQMIEVHTPIPNYKDVITMSGFGVWDTRYLVETI
ncbi:uncharacterized protein LOC108733558 isoform X2 [Agrilus planipennis]|uniref:Uncharacterized protein LOC108733558 isoform X2 n=1 Tax=Agrilus planipennis TaxID=224129 RepID=A0A7F5RJM1_AGRPL|nr:uncharacterized protein LOC108733558 isoform X2 [Agrilus planipennis]